MPKVTIANHNVTVESSPALNLLNNFAVGQAPIHTVCGGRGRCGCCRIKILFNREGVSAVAAAEVSKLGDELVAAGWRLSCQSYAVQDITVYMPTADELNDICSEE